MKNLTNDTTFYTESLEDNMTLLNVEEAASLLMVGKNRIYELLNQGKLKGMRIGKSTWRIPKLSIYQFIREQSSL
nr:helix-turn-helix domain-containing protein [uncultured Agathobacter sp.]